MLPIIAIDGPAASGKGTLARKLAEHFRFAYLDSGRLYRAFACIELILADKPSALLHDCRVQSANNEAPSDLFEDQGLLSTLSDILRISENKNDEIDLSCYLTRSNFLSDMLKGGQDLVKIADVIPEHILKSEIVGMEASSLGKFPEVRTLLTALMRDFAYSPGDEYRGTVMDGRDIGTVVFPNATCKFFVTADLRTRAERRFNDMKVFGTATTFEAVYDALKARDEHDANRDVSPMKCDNSYVRIDTTHLSVDDALSELVKLVGNTLQIS